jgi:hypothetical protein
VFRCFGNATTLRVKLTPAIFIYVFANEQQQKNIGGCQAERMRVFDDDDDKEGK